MVVDWWENTKKVLDEWVAAIRFLVVDAIIFLTALFNDPIGTLWAYLELAWDVPYAWAMDWLIENTPPPGTDEADLRETDSLIPSVDAYLSGLFDPVTAAEQAFDAALDRWVEQIMDETINQHPYQFPEIA